ncbi:protein phosphatase 2C domain-containing protein [Streptomyces durbertensis]|uniref:Protein phosphatase 2C domain-containing protein n=1 Tax=Streptomyces durbertensis TaxID=2448886 RepID=A0ABR6EED7_9ACTN|nr:protein phosphatase 2C domain-containing protein [Streptomyces durbertensis]MBB1243538.1 protein phosphatase 2C domain-containing protein [Streptomyces durbertensis]
MDGQGERAPEHDWWSRLYGEENADVGRAPVGDTVDERFDSASRATTAFPAQGGAPPERSTDEDGPARPAGTAGGGDEDRSGAGRSDAGRTLPLGTRRPSVPRGRDGTSSTEAGKPRPTGPPEGSGPLDPAPPRADPTGRPAATGAADAPEAFDSANAGAAGGSAEVTEVSGQRRGRESRHRPPPGEERPAEEESSSARKEADSGARGGDRPADDPARGPATAAVVPSPGRPETGAAATGRGQSASEPAAEPAVRPATRRLLRARAAALPDPSGDGARRGRGAAGEREYIGDRPPTYEPEPTVLPTADPERLGELVPDTVLDGTRHGTLTVRAVSQRGDSGRFRGRPRGDALLTAGFGVGEEGLLLVAVASGSRAASAGHLAAREVCEWIGGAIGRSRVRLVEDLREGRRSALKSGLGRLTARSLGRLRASAAQQGLDPADYTAGLRCLLLPADPRCRVRLFFGVGPGGLFRLRDGSWQDLEPASPAGPTVAGGGLEPGVAPGPGAEDLTGPATGGPTGSGESGPEPVTPPFLFRTSLAEAGDTLLLCSGGMAGPLRGEREFRAVLAERWSGAEAPGLADFLADVQLRAKGYADDRTAVGVWEGRSI